MAKNELNEPRPSSADSNATEFYPDLNIRHTDFARLSPADDLTKAAFHEVVTKITSEPDWNLRARRFIHVDPDQVDLDAFSSSEPESSTGHDGNKVWTGCYCFSFDNLPDDLDRWIAGGGVEDRPDGGVDLLLTLSKREHRVHGRHGRFTHADSGAFMLHNDKRRIYVNQNEVVEGAYHLAAPTTRLTFGRLTYLLEWTRLSEEEYRDQLQQVRAFTGANPVTTPRSLELTPSERQYEYRQRYFFQAPIDSGSFGTIIPGTEKKSGKAIVVKRVKRTPGNALRVDQEISIYKKLGSHPRICGLIEVLWSSKDALRPVESNTDDVFYILENLMDQTFLAPKAYPFPLLREVFRQVIEGVQYIHESGIMHRDIKPQNLMFSVNPPHGVITDFGCATFKDTSTDYSIGTMPYLAPEIIALLEEDEREKRGRPNSDEPQRIYSAPSYGKPVDIWGLGIAGYALFLSEKCTWRRIEPGTHDIIIAKLRSRSGIADTIADMLFWAPGQRPTAASLLERDIWSV